VPERASFALLGSARVGLGAGAGPSWRLDPALPGSRRGPRSRAPDAGRPSDPPERASLRPAPQPGSRTEEDRVERPPIRGSPDRSSGCRAAPPSQPELPRQGRSRALGGSTSASMGEGDLGIRTRRPAPRGATPRRSRGCATGPSVPSESGTGALSAPSDPRYIGRSTWMPLAGIAGLCAGSLGRGCGAGRSTGVGGVGRCLQSRAMRASSSRSPSPRAQVRPGASHRGPAVDPLAHRERTWTQALAARART
jgi:hypothetical protein